MLARLGEIVYTDPILLDVAGVPGTLSILWLGSTRQADYFRQAALGR